LLSGVKISTKGKLQVAAKKLITHSHFMFKHFVVLFIIGLLSIPQTAFGQLSVDLDSISVTASRITTSVSESGKSVSVLTQRDIEEMPITSVDELLRTLPG